MREQIIKTLSSKWTTAILLFLFSASYIFFIYFPSGSTPFKRWVDFISVSPLGLFLYICLILNIALLTISNIKKNLDTTCDIETIKGMGTYVVIPNSRSFEGLAKEMGLKIRSEGFAQRGRYSFMPGLILRFGLIVFMSSLMLSLYVRRTEEVILTKGESRGILGRNITLSDINTDLPDEFLSVGEDSPFKLKDISAIILIDGEKIKVDSGIPARVGMRYYRISDMGFSQEISISGGKRVLNLEVLPPGKVSKVSLESGSSLDIRIEPEKIIKRGLLTGRLYNLKNPLYHISFLDGSGKAVDEAILRQAEEKALNGINLSLGSQGIFIKLISIYDPTLMFIYIGLILILLGVFLMPLRFFWYERRMCASPMGDETMIGYSEEIFSKWGIERFHRKIEGVLEQ